MSELKTNKVSPATSTALAIGDSGDTITVPSGATLDISASTLTPPATMPASSGINFTALNATNLGSGTVPTARLGSGTADATTFLRGDQTYAAAGGGKVLQVVASTLAVETRTKSTTLTGTGLTATLTPAATSSKILIFVNGGTILTGAWEYDSFTALYSDIGGAGASKIADIGANYFGHSGSGEGGSQSMSYLYSPSTTSAVVIEPYYKSSSGSYWAYFTQAPYSVSLILMEIGA